MHQANAKRNALMFSQWEFINTRMMAYEYVTSKRFGVLLAFISPTQFKKAVDSVQLRMLAESNKKAEEASKKPKLTIVGA